MQQGLRRFNERAAREPRMWDKAVLLFLAVAAPLWLGAERGVAVGVAAAVVYSGLFVLGVLRHRRLVEWSRAHPHLDLLWLPPLAFLGFAGLLDWPLWVCAAAALTLGAVVAAAAVALRRRRVVG